MSALIIFALGLSLFSRGSVAYPNEHEGAVAEPQDVSSQALNSPEAQVPMPAYSADIVIANWVGEYASFLSMTEHPTQVGEFEPLYMRATAVSLLGKESALLVEQAFLSDYIEQAAQWEGDQASLLATVSFRRVLYRFTQSKSGSLVQLSYPLKTMKQSTQGRLLNETVAQETSGQMEQARQPKVAFVEDFTVPKVVQGLKRLPGCELVWDAGAEVPGETEAEHQARLEAGQLPFVAYRTPERCYFISSGDKEQVHLVSYIKIQGADTYLSSREGELRGTAQSKKIEIFEDYIYNSQDSKEDRPEAVKLILEPIQFYDLVMQYLPEGESAEDEKAWVNIMPESFIHDQGQRINLHTEEGKRVLPYQIQLQRNKNNELLVSIYSLGENSPMRELSVELEQGRGMFESLPLRVELKSLSFKGDLPEQRPQ